MADCEHATPIQGLRPSNNVRQQTLRLALAQTRPSLMLSPNAYALRLGEIANMTKSAPPSDENRLLALLRSADYARLEPHLEPVSLEYRQSLYRAHAKIDAVYFLESGVGSLVNTMNDGRAAEVGTVGNEGVVGLPLVFGDERAPTSLYMQVPGAGLRMPAKAFLKALSQSPTMQAVFLRYAHAFFNQVAQSAACNHFHTLEQRCCRWLLMTQDRMPGNEFLLTQEFLAMMLGVQRTGVTVAARGLQRAGLITYSRGHVNVLDRRGLKSRSCECYVVSKREFDRLLGD